jgi:hypothetical protein
MSLLYVPTDVSFDWHEVLPPAAHPEPPPWMCMLSSTPVVDGLAHFARFLCRIGSVLFWRWDGMQVPKGGALQGKEEEERREKTSLVKRNLERTRMTAACPSQEGEMSHYLLVCM